MHPPNLHDEQINQVIREAVELFETTILVNHDVSQLSSGEWQLNGDLDNSPLWGKWIIVNNGRALKKSPC